MIRLEGHEEMQAHQLTWPAQLIFGSWHDNKPYTLPRPRQKSKCLQKMVLALLTLSSCVPLHHTAYEHGLIELIYQEVGEFQAHEVLHKQMGTLNT